MSPRFPLRRVVRCGEGVLRGTAGHRAGGGGGCHDHRGELRGAGRGSGVQGWSGINKGTIGTRESWGKDEGFIGIYNDSRGFIGIFRIFFWIFFVDL